LPHPRVPPHSPSAAPAQHAQNEPSPTPRSPVVGRWSSGATITRSWRIGSIPLQSIATGFKTLASRVAQAVARPSAARRASESEESRTVNLHSPDRKAVGLRGTQTAGKEVIQKLDKALTDNLIAMLCDPTTETVDASGICRAFASDLFRLTDVIDKVADLQKPNEQSPKSALNGETYMKDMGTRRFASDTAIMEAFTKLAHQGAYVPVMEKMGALLGKCDFSTPVADALAVFLPKTTRRFELHAATVTSDTALLEVSMHLDGSISGISDPTGSMTHFSTDTSRAHFSSCVKIEIDRRQVLPPSSPDPTPDKKSTEPKGSLHADTSGEKRHPSRLPRDAIKLTVADTQFEYRLDPA
jgi:hypothetical protein